MERQVGDTRSARAAEQHLRFVGGVLADSNRQGDEHPNGVAQDGAHRPGTRRRSARHLHVRQRGRPHHGRRLPRRTQAHELQAEAHDCRDARVSGQAAAIKTSSQNSLYVPRVCAYCVRESRQKAEGGGWPTCGFTPQRTVNEVASLLM